MFSTNIFDVVKIRRGKGGNERVPPKFDLGATAYSRGVQELMTTREGVQEVMKCLAHHHYGNWGDVSEEDRQRNERALHEGGSCAPTGFAQKVSQLGLFLSRLRFCLKSRLYP